MPLITDKEVGHGDKAIGFGLMGFTWRENLTPYPQAIATMKTALNTGANLWNGGQIYGPPHANSLQLLNAYFTEHPEDADRVAICIKGGINFEKHGPDGSPEWTRKCVDECLKVLDGKKFLDMWECARVDPTTPIEDTIETLAEYVKAGKLGGICLSECGPDTVRRAAKVHKIEGVELEFSLFETEILHNGIAKACAENDIPVIAYSPLSRGFLTSQINSVEGLPENDRRRAFPRFQPGNFEKNMALVEHVRSVAERKGCTLAQVALAWIMAKSGKNGNPVIIPIPGATTGDRVEENNKLVELSVADEKELDEFVKKAEVVGARYGPPYDHLMYGETRPRD